MPFYTYATLDLVLMTKVRETMFACVKDRANQLEYPKKHMGTTKNILFTVGVWLLTLHLSTCRLHAVYIHCSLTRLVPVAPG